MQKRNFIFEIIQAMGFQTITPTDALLEKLNGMSNIRFFQILNNKSKLEMTVLEAELLSGWLLELTGRELDIFDPKSADKLKAEPV